MYVLIDRARMCACYKHPDLSVLMNLAHIELSHAATIIVSPRSGMERFTDLELKLLYTNLCGFKAEGFNRDVLIVWINAMLDSLEVIRMNPAEVQAQADAIPFSEDGHYRFVPGLREPVPINEPLKHEPLTAPQGFVPSTPISNPVQSTAASYTQAATLPASAPQSERVASAPSPKGATGRVWVIADKVLAEIGNSDWKALRKAIVSACEAEGINPSTASVQFGKWKSTKL